MPRGNSRRKVSNTLRKYIEKMWLQKMTGSTCYYRGHMTEVATLKKALSKAEDNAAAERAEREKQEARA